jgi:uncharacterized Zn-binding protein involved in type VI secretion
VKRAVSRVLGSGFHPFRKKRTMSQRINILGKGQGLDGDQTTTGALCIAGQARGRVHGRGWLLVGDKTTPCPLCGNEGTIVEGESRWKISAKVCWRFGPYAAACGIVITGGGAVAGSIGGMQAGEEFGELVFEVFGDD